MTPFSPKQTLKKEEREKHRRERTSAFLFLLLLLLRTHQTPHPTDYKPVGNPGRDRSHAHESRQRRSRIRSHLPFLISYGAFAFFPREEFLESHIFRVSVKNSKKKGVKNALKHIKARARGFFSQKEEE